MSTAKRDIALSEAKRLGVVLAGQARRDTQTLCRELAVAIAAITGAEVTADEVYRACMSGVREMLRGEVPAHYE